MEGGQMGAGSDGVNAAIMSGAGALAGLKRFKKKRSQKSLNRDRKVRRF